MRLLVVAKTYPPDTSARALQGGKVVDALRGAGVDARVLAGCPASSRRQAQPSGTLAVPFRPPPEGRSPAARAARFATSVLEVAGLSRWVVRGLVAADALLRDWRPDLILSQSVPFDSHRLAAGLGRRLGVPWIAFFSDPWPPGVLGPPYGQAEVRWLTRCQAREAHRLLGRAAAIVAPTREVAALVARAADLPPHTLIGEVLHVATPAAAATELAPIVLHAGEISGPRCSASLVAGLAGAAQELAARGGRLRFVGKVVPEFERALRMQVADGSVEFAGMQPPAAAAAEAAAARALLLVEADAPASPFLPSKAADYAVTGRPIAAVTPDDSALRRLLRGRPGIHLARHEPTAIARAIVAAWDQGGRPAAAAPDTSFAPETVARLYLAIMHSVLAPRGAPASSAAERPA